MPAVEIPLGGETRSFDLKLRGQIAIEERCGVGLGQVMARLVTGLGEPHEYRFYVHDYRETILRGLIDGGMSSQDASRVVEKEIDGHPVKDAIVIAIQILRAWYFGLPPGKQAAPGTSKEAVTAPAASTGAKS